MAEGPQTTDEQKDPEDASDLWPEEYRKVTKDKIKLKRREADRIRIRQELFDDVVKAQERYEKSNDKKDLLAIRVAKNKYINFIFLSEGAAEAEKAEQHFAESTGAFIKEKRRRKLEGLYEWGKRWGKFVAYGVLLLAVSAATFAFGLIGVPVGAAVIAGLSLFVLRDPLFLSFTMPKMRERIEKLKRAEEESRQKGETYEEFQAKNLVLITEAAAARARIKAWSQGLGYLIGAGALAVGVVPGIPGLDITVEGAATGVFNAVRSLFGA